MINKRIYELDSFTGITGNNYLLVDDSSLSSSKKLSIDSLKTYVLSGVSYGTSGTDGTSGSSGSSGTSGTNGTSGSSGSSGTSGLAGDKYSTTSNSTFNMPIISGITIYLTGGTGLAYTIGQSILIAYNEDIHFEAEIISYDALTGYFVVKSEKYFEGIGSYSSWKINLAGAVGQAGSSGSSGSSGINGTSGSSGTNGTSGSSGINGSGSAALSAGTFTQTLTFDSSKYYSSYNQWENVIFAATSGGTNVPLNVVYMQINLNRLYTVSFGTNFEMNRNDIDGNNGSYDFWFVYKPNGNIAYSIVKTGTYQPIALLPLSGNTVARYSASNVTTDPTSGKVTKIVNTYNDLFSLYSVTDATRPILDSTNNRLVFNSTGKTENLSGGTTITFVSGTTWYVGALIQLDPIFGENMAIFRSTTGNTLSPGDKDTSYINTFLTTQLAASGIHNKLAGVHILGWNQTSGTSELYFDDTLVLSNTKTGLTLSLSNVLSTYVNNTTASASRIKYLYDMIIYNRNMNSTERSAISSFFKTNYSQFDPTTGPTIISYQTSGITSGTTLSSGNTINVTYTVTSSGTVATNLVIVWKNGGGTLRGMTVSDSPTSVVVPVLPPGAGYWTTGYILDQYGRASNAIDYSGTGTRFTIA